MNKLHIDIETYSSVDIFKSGVYKYVESPDFEILLIAYSLNNEPVNIIDLCENNLIPLDFLQLLHDPLIVKCAHNANFERLCFKSIGHDTPISFWECSLVKSAYCGLPLSLDGVSKALNLEEKGKLSTGKALIRYFCMPCKPTKSNGQRQRNLPQHHFEKWEDFKKYCINDVIAEKEISRILSDYKLPVLEQKYYVLDQEINDRGLEIDIDMVKACRELDQEFNLSILGQMRKITGVDNPNSGQQLKEWLSKVMGKEIKSLTKESTINLIEEAADTIHNLGSDGDAELHWREIENLELVIKVLGLKQKISKTSTKKYESMLNCFCDDGRAHGLLQFYGANRTGRWAGRLIQVQNLPQNHLDDLELTRNFIKNESFETNELLYDNLSNILSQLIRTAFIAGEEKLFAVADYSAIEARVIAWFANEKWRLDVFNSHGKIYEASASKMFGIPIDQITKGSDARAKGKIAELALGYQGGVGAMLRMGGEKMGLSETEMQRNVELWRLSNPAIVSLWKKVEEAAKKAIVRKSLVETPFRGLSFSYDGIMLKTHLPSGRHLSYWKPSFTENNWGFPSIQYMGMDQTTKKWWNIKTYGGKLVENIVQAFARDILAYSMLKLKNHGFDIVMHVHDEIICEVDYDIAANGKLDDMCSIMSEEIPWAKDLPLDAEGYLTPYYKKD